MWAESPSWLCIALCCSLLTCHYYTFYYLLLLLCYCYCYRYNCQMSAKFVAHFPNLSYVWVLFTYEHRFIAALGCRLASCTAYVLHFIRIFFFYFLFLLILNYRLGICSQASEDYQNLIRIERNYWNCVGKRFM